MVRITQEFIRFAFDGDFLLLLSLNAKDEGSAEFSLNVGRPIDTYLYIFKLGAR